MKTFLNGLGLVIPTSLILYILIWILTQTEFFLKKILLTFMPLAYYISGMGFIFRLITVYISGYTLFIPKKNLTHLDMKIEDALRFVTTAGISNNYGDKNA